MDLGFVFKMSLYGLTALVGAILGCAESEGVAYASGRLGFALPFLSIPIVICGYLFTEIQWRQDRSVEAGLNSFSANFLGIAALIATGIEFMSENREGKLLAGTHLLLYVTWIVLFQRKTVRLYWFLMALGILQLALASVLTTKGWFGFCALAYTFGAVWTLSIFSLWRAEQQFEEEEKIRLAEATPIPAGGVVFLSANNRLRSEVRGAVQHEDGTRWLTARFVSGVLLTTCSALLVSAAFFTITPRVWVGSTVSLSEDREVLNAITKKSGLASVRLGELGRILESMDRVFEIQLRNLNTGKLISVQEYAEQLGMAEPLFRAEVLTEYQSGRWSVHRFNGLNNRAFKRPDERSDIEQAIRRDANETGVLFCLGVPQTSVDSRRQIFGDLNEWTGVATQNDQKKESGLLVYTVNSVLPPKQSLHYSYPVSDSTGEAYNRHHYFEDLKKLPGNLTRLQELAHRIVNSEVARRQKAEAQSVPRDLTLMEIATAIEEYLRDSGEYRYTLDQSILDPKIDPIEDFLFNRKEGHCEYFATALALMLRAENIPARLVSGYKGGIANPDKKDWLEIQQRFAHVWVEAWVDKVGWTTFDATPVNARLLSVAGMSAKKTSLWSDMQTAFAGLWSDNILNMSFDRQEQSIYKPMRKMAFNLAIFMRQLFTSPESALRMLFDLITNRNYWFSTGGVIFIISLLLALAAFAWSARWLFAWANRWLDKHSRRRIRKQHRFVEFYERFTGMMKSHGLKRSPNQTQREFAEMVASQYSSDLEFVGEKDIPEQISRLFYKVRFGESELTIHEENEIQLLLAKLDRALSKDVRHHRDTHSAFERERSGIS